MCSDGETPNRLSLYLLFQGVELGGLPISIQTHYASKSFQEDLEMLSSCFLWCQTIQHDPNCFSNYNILLQLPLLRFSSISPCLAPGRAAVCNHSRDDQTDQGHGSGVRDVPQRPVATVDVFGRDGRSWCRGWPGPVDGAPPIQCWLKKPQKVSLVTPFSTKRTWAFGGQIPLTS